jgi:hypothetical protein
MRGPLTLIFALAMCIVGLLYFKGRPPQNHYEALGVTRYATESEIKTQFRKTALKFHPDKNPGDEEAIKRFHELVNAKDTLMDPQKRREYDEHLDRPLGAEPTPQHRHQQQQQRQHQQQSAPHGSWSFRTDSWNCQTSTCWWFTYIRDTFWQYCSFWGFVNLIFFLGVGTVILDWFIPTFFKVVMYVLCNCFWRPLTRTKAVVRKEKEKEDDMRQKMRERYAKTEGVKKNT